MADLVEAVREQLGEPLTSYLAAPEVTDPPGAGSASQEVAARRLREAYVVVAMVAAAYDLATAETWLFGTNSHLDDRAPIDVLRRATDVRTLDLVRGAAAAFVEAAGSSGSTADRPT